MTADQIKTRLAKLANIHEQEIGCRVGELQTILQGYAKALDERDQYRTLSELKEAEAYANRMNNNRLVAENAGLRAVIGSRDAQAIELADSIRQMGSLIIRLAESTGQPELARKISGALEQYIAEVDAIRRIAA